MECDLGDLVIHYEAMGEGRPLILLHGWYLDHRSMAADYEPVFRARLGWRRIYPDLPGMGRTPGPDGIAGNDDMLAVLLRFLDAVLQGERFVAVGYSYGAYLARGLVHRRGGSMDGLLLVAPIVDPGRTGTSETRVLVRDPHLAADLAREESKAYASLAVVQSPAGLRHFQDHVLPGLQAADATFIRRLKEPFTFDVDALPEAFERPTLLVTGRQDGYTGWRETWDLLGPYPKATFAVLDGAGHFVGRPGERVRAFRALIGDWLDRVEEGTDGEGGGPTHAGERGRRRATGGI